MDIREDQRQNLVIIGEVSLEGWLDSTPCAQCGERRIYYLAYDAFFCASCNQWLQLCCDDPTCAGCVTRPARPLEHLIPS